MASTLLNLPNHAFTVGDFNSGNLAVPAGNGLDFSFTFASTAPNGRAIDNALMDVRADLSTDGGATFPSFAGAQLTGGVVRNKNGVVILTYGFSWNWGAQTPTHIKFTISVYVAFTATVIVTNL